MASNVEGETTVSDNCPDIHIKEEKPVVHIENKSSMEILSELFSTFDAEPPVIVKKEKLDDKKLSKKQKKKSKKKDKNKKHKKKMKKLKKRRKEDDSENAAGSDNEAIDLSDILVKSENFWSSSITDTLQKIIKSEGLLTACDLKQEKETRVLKCEDEPEDNKDKSKDCKEKQSKNKYCKKKIKFNIKQVSTLDKASDMHHKRKKHKCDHYHDDIPTKKSKRDRSKSPKATRKFGLEENRDSDGFYDKYRLEQRHRSDHRSYRDSYYDEGRHHRDRYKDDNDFYRGYTSERNECTKSRHSTKSDRTINDKHKDDEATTRIDKKKLLEIARKNAIEMMKNGTIPNTLQITTHVQDQMMTSSHEGGKTIAELTDFCKNLSKKENLGDLSSISDISENEDERQIRHPFKIVNKPFKLTKSFVPLPPTTSTVTQLSIQYPVSSGQIHRKTEHEVEPVPAVPPPPPIPIPMEPVGPGPSEPVIMPPVQAAVQQTPTPVQNPAPHSISPTGIGALPPPTLIEPVKGPYQNLSGANSSNITAQPESDLSEIIAQRLAQIRNSQEFPSEIPAPPPVPVIPTPVQFNYNTNIPNSQPNRNLGHFTGSTGANILTHAELSSGSQAWARKDQLQKARPLSGGMGMHLLQKMGWKPGEGLGKEKTGALEPLLLEVKLDKKGIVAKEETKKPKAIKMPVKKTIIIPQGKHPGSMLFEYAAKRKFKPPEYILDFECGPDHMKNFLFKVRLNGVDYKPNVASGTKKEAKAMAATVCLQALGILPTDLATVVIN